MLCFWLLIEYLSFTGSAFAHYRRLMGSHIPILHFGWPSHLNHGWMVKRHTTMLIECEKLSSLSNSWIVFRLNFTAGLLSESLRLWLMLRDSRTSMQYCISPLRWNKPQTKSWSMFQFRSMTEVNRFTISGRGVDLPKELIWGAFHRMFGAQDVPGMDILLVIVNQLCH